MDALAGERVEIDGQRGDQRLAFAGAHLGDARRRAAPCRRSAARRSAACRARGARASRTVAKAGTSRSSSVAPSASSARNSSVRPRSCVVGQRPHLVSSALIASTRGRVRLDAAVVGRAEDLAGEAAETDHIMVLSIDVRAGWRRRIRRPGKTWRIRERQKAPGKRFWTQGRRTDKRGLNRCQRAQLAPNRAEFRHNPAASRRRKSDRRLHVAFVTPRSVRQAGAASIAVAALTACALAQATAARPTAPATPPRRRAEPDDTVVATIDGKPSHRGRPRRWRMADLDQQFAQLPAEQRRAAALLGASSTIKLLAAKRRRRRARQGSGLPAPHRVPARPRAAQRGHRQGRRAPRSPTTRSRPATTRRSPRLPRRSTRSTPATSW